MNSIEIRTNGEKHSSSFQIPELRRAILEAADSYHKKNDLSAARDFLVLLEQCEGHTAETLQILGNLHCLLGEYQPARSVYERAIAEAPENASLWLARAVACLHLKDEAALKDSLSKALALEPQNPEALKILADHHLQLGNIREAACTYGRLPRQNQDRVEVLLPLARCFFELGDPAAAKSALERSLAIEPSNQLARENLAALNGKLCASRATDHDQSESIDQVRTLSRPLNGGLVRNGIVAGNGHTTPHANGVPDGGERKLSREQIIEEMNRIQWWHRIPLGDGIVTPGMVHHGEDHEDYASERFGLPLNLKGKTVLDVGAWDGYFSFEAERRGASSVLAADISIRSPDEVLDRYGSAGNWGANKGFLFARKALRSKVEYINASIYEVGDVLKKMGTLYPPVFDYVFFFGVLYHLREPLLALEKLAAITGEVALIETACMEGEGTAMEFRPGHDNDPSNYWYPSYGCLRAMLLNSGFRSVEKIADIGLRITVRAYK